MARSVWFVGLLILMSRGFRVSQEGAFSTLRVDEESWSVERGRGARGVRGSAGIHACRSPKYVRVGPRTARTAEVVLMPREKANATLDQNGDNPRGGACVREGRDWSFHACNLRR